MDILKLLACSSVQFGHEDCAVTWKHDAAKTKKNMLAGTEPYEWEIFLRDFESWQDQRRKRLKGHTRDVTTQTLMNYGKPVSKPQVRSSFLV